jgi:hypothetical protein
MNEATQAVAVTVPPEVRAFAAEQGVSAELPAVLEMTRRLFPDATVRTSIDEDPEIANDRHIAIEVTARGLSSAKALESRWEWHRGLFACCPAPLVCVFRLGLELAP